MHNLAVNLERSAALFPSKAAFRMGDDEINYALLDKFAGNIATNLNRLGLKVGDKVALSCPNITYFPIVYYGILKAGCVVVPLNVLFKGREIAYHLNDSDAKAYFCFEGSEELPMGSYGRHGVSLKLSSANTLSLCQNDAEKKSTLLMLGLCKTMSRLSQ